MSVEDPGETVNRLKGDEKEQTSWTVAETENAAAAAASKTVAAPQERRVRRRHGPSLFGPLVLVAAGGYFLLRNLGIALPDPNWAAALRLWPLLLVFSGLNMIVRQAPRPLAALLSFVTSVAFVGIFGYALFFAETLPFGDMWDDQTVIVDELRFESPATEADVVLEFSAQGGSLDAGVAGGPLLAGQVSYVGDLRLNTETRGDRATVNLDARQPWWSIWSTAQGAEPWALALAPDVGLDLDLETNSGRVNADLSALTLEALRLDSGSGAVTVALPAGQYRSSLDFGSGAATVTFAPGTDLDVRLDSGSGAVRLRIPEGVEAQLTVDGGSGAFSPDGRFTLVDGDWDDGVWQTAGFDGATTRLVVSIDQGSGAVTVNTP